MDFNEKQPKHQNRNFLKTFASICDEICILPSFNLIHQIKDHSITRQQSCVRNMRFLPWTIIQKIILPAALDPEFTALHTTMTMHTCGQHTMNGTIQKEKGSRCDFHHRFYCLCFHGLLFVFECIVVIKSINFSHYWQ